MLKQKQILKKEEAITHTMLLTLTTISQTITNLTTNIVIGVLIILLGFVIGKIIDITLTKILNELEIDKNIKKIRKGKTNIGKVLPKSIAITIYIASVIIALIQIGIITTILLIILYAAILIAAGAIILNLIDIIPNIIQYFKLKNKFKIGDEIQTKLVKGTIQKIGLTNTKIINQKKETFYLSNTYLGLEKTKITKQN